MSLNGSGLYTPPSAYFPILNGTNLDATQVDNIITDMSTAISNAVMKDGQQTVTANLPMNGFKLTGVGAGSARTDAATVANLQDGTGIYVTVVGGTGTAITLAPSPSIAAYATGQNFRFMVLLQNSGSTTVSVSGLAAKPLYSKNNTALVGNDLRIGDVVEIYYDAAAGTAGAFILGGGGFQSQLTGQLLDACVLRDCLVTDNPTNTAGVVPKSYVDSMWTTGDVKVTIRPTPDTGWLIFDDGTIGSASSGATSRANADTEDLFTLLWDITTNANCPVSGGRGTSASADFAANKTIALPKLLGRALAMAGAGSGLTSRGLAEALGSEDAINVSHTHTATQATHSHTWEYTAAGAGSVPTVVAAGAVSGSSGGGPTASATPVITVASSGSSGNDANMQPTVFLFCHVKL